VDTIKSLIVTSMVCIRSLRHLSIYSIICKCLDFFFRDYKLLSFLKP